MPYQRKADDNVIVNLNSVGLSLTGIGERVGVHHTTVKYRLKDLGVPPADTRRAFMEDIFEALTPAQQDWLIGQMSPVYPIKDYIRSLLIKEFMASRVPEGHGS